MKICKVVIENFRHIERLELGFLDSLDRVRDVTLLVGPNTCGKTTVLDAIAAALGPLTKIRCLRPDLELTPKIVRRGSLRARVTCTVRFSAEEIETAREVRRLAKLGGNMPDANEVEITWEYPDPQEKFSLGRTRCNPKGSWALFEARYRVAKLLSTRVVDASWFARVGAVFTFDQQRTGMGKTIPREIWHVIHGGSSGVDAPAEERHTTDPRSILLSLAIQSQLPSKGDSNRPDLFHLVQKRYAEICAPRRIVGPVKDEFDGFDVMFNDGNYEYGFAGLSSGEQMVMIFLLRMVTEHIHQSVVLVDEIELHQHPIWQRRLLDLLPRMGDSNQIIATTHSRYLRDAIPEDAVIALGELEESRA